MSKTPKKDDYFESAGRVIRVGDYVEVLTRHKTKGKGVVVAIRDNLGRFPDTIVLKMDSNTVYSDVNRAPEWPHDRERIADLGVFGGEVTRIIPKTIH